MTKIQIIESGEHEEEEEASATEAGGLEGSNESVGADGDEELPVSQASQEDDDDDPAKVEDDAASATEEEDWEEGGESGSSDTTPTGATTSGMSIKQPWMTPCLPTSIVIVGEIASAPLLRESVLFIGTQFSILYTFMYSPA